MEGAANAVPLFVLQEEAGMATYNTEFLRALSEYRGKSISQSFEDLLTRAINIPEGIRSTASASQQNLRKFLHDECQRDSGFPPVLKTADGDFLGGSFARHTKTWPLDDIDIYLPLDGANLSYILHGTVLPYTVQTDGLLGNPLLTPRWASGQYVSSTKLIEEFAAVLKRRFPETKVKPGGQAVEIQMTHGQTSTTDGLGYDIVPCFSLKPLQKDDAPFYLMPDGQGGWIRTNPRSDAAVADILQENHNSLFRKVVKLLKYWNTEQLGGALSSYFVELSVARVYLDKVVKSESVTTLSHGVALAFWAVQQAVTQGAQSSWVVHAPPVLPGSLTATQLMVLKSDVNRACAAWEDEKAGNMVSSAAKWKCVFGSKLPD
jgi:hypothetical protein